jgi:hypothetical protein
MFVSKVGAYPMLLCYALRLPYSQILYLIEILTKCKRTSLFACSVSGKYKQVLKQISMEGSWPYLQNIRLGCNSLPGTNTLAYLAHS